MKWKFLQFNERNISENLTLTTCNEVINIHNYIFRQNVFEKKYATQRNIERDL